MICVMCALTGACAMEEHRIASDTNRQGWDGYAYSPNCHSGWKVTLGSTEHQPPTGTNEKGPVESRALIRAREPSEEIFLASLLQRGTLPCARIIIIT